MVRIKRTVEQGMENTECDVFKSCPVLPKGGGGDRFPSLQISLSILKSRSISKLSGEMSIINCQRL